VPVDLIEFKDNQPTLDLLEAKTVGVFAMVDEEINVPKGSDETFLKKVLTKHDKHPNFQRPKPKDLNANMVFVIVHYAGAVPYNVSSFLEKNKDSLHEVRARARLPLRLCCCACAALSALLLPLLLAGVALGSPTDGTPNDEFDGSLRL
jgi:hypothetical protein